MMSPGPFRVRTFFLRPRLYGLFPISGDFLFDSLNFIVYTYCSNAEVAELADALVSEASAARHEGSSPSLRIINLLTGGGISR